MARRGRFGRSASGSQNLSSLVYSLLKEERNNQETTMLTAYKNNMMSGSAAGLFTSDGTTRPATAATLVDWYKAQASAADAVGDSTGAERFRTQAEEFRIQSLRDIETVLDNAYKAGNSIDLSLIGGSGSAKIDGAAYEKWMNTILGDEGMTVSDRERLKSKLYTVSYNYAAENMVNGFNEKKYTANQLVKFYDAELVRARANGLTATSQTYRDIVQARASAISRAKTDAENARGEAIENGMRDETDAMASAIQRLVKPILGNYVSSTDVVESLSKDFGKGNGDDWLTRFSNIVQSSGMDYSAMFDAGASANGLSVEEMRSIAGIFGDLSTQLEELKSQGYGADIGKWITFADEVSTKYTNGAFAASTRPYVTSFNGEYAKVGGSIGVQFSGEPGATRDALNQLVGSVAGAGFESNVTDSSTIAQVNQYGSGYIEGLVPGNPAIKTIGDLVDFLSANGATAGMDKTDIANGIGEWLFVMKNNPNAATSGAIPNELYNLGIAGTMSALDNALGGAGSVTTGDILRLYIESTYIPKSITDTVDPNGNPTRAMAYKMNPKTGEFTFSVVPSANVGSKDYVISTGKNGDIYYTQSIPFKGEDGLVNGKKIRFVPVPGGGNYAGGNDANDLIILDFTAGMGKPVAFTSAQIESFTTWYSSQPNATTGDFSGFRLEPDASTPGIMNFTAGNDLLRALTATGLFGTPAITDWMKAAGINLKDVQVTNVGGTLLLGEDFLSDYRMEIFTSGAQGTDARNAVSNWLRKNKGITDPGGKILNMILNGLELSADQGDGGLTWNIFKDGIRYTNSTDNTKDNLPPAPAGSKPDPNAFASTDPSFGINGNPQPTAPLVQNGAGMGGTAGVRGTQTGKFIPTSDLMEHTFRNIAPSLTPVDPIAPPPGGRAPIIGPGLNPDGPGVTAPAVSPGIPNSKAPGGPSMRPSDTTRRMRNL